MCTGFSAASASWKIIAIRSPRIGCSCFSDRPSEVLPANTHLAGDLRGVGQQAEDRQRRDGLARARLPHDPERLARGEVEAHVVDRVHDAVVGLEVDT